MRGVLNVAPTTPSSTLYAPLQGPSTAPNIRKKLQDALHPGLSSNPLTTQAHVPPLQRKCPYSVGHGWRGGPLDRVPVVCFQDLSPSNHPQPHPPSAAPNGIAFCPGLSSPPQCGRAIHPWDNHRRIMDRWIRSTISRPQAFHSPVVNQAPTAKGPLLQLASPPQTQRELLSVFLGFTTLRIPPPIVSDTTFSSAVYRVRIRVRYIFDTDGYCSPPKKRRQTQEPSRMRLERPPLKTSIQALAAPPDTTPTTHKHQAIRTSTETTWYYHDNRNMPGPMARCILANPSVTTYLTPHKAVERQPGTHTHTHTLSVH
ncbi:hypothetical protein CSAL01_06149 [Colletotrichum salicis]|uniref:Uncharacterized protein n=1 Tax=Colletotrichum salicis TaxID=1209931 RepID=A0A135V286_9PEZI|nr:hypothetical protein CSAL01_06149 [Colletotrichum salicis]